MNWIQISSVQKPCAVLIHIDYTASASISCYIHSAQVMICSATSPAPKMSANVLLLETWSAAHFELSSLLNHNSATGDWLNELMWTEHASKPEKSWINNNKHIKMEVRISQNFDWYPTWQTTWLRWHPLALSGIPLDRNSRKRGGSILWDGMPSENSTPIYYWRSGCQHNLLVSKILRDDVHQFPLLLFFPSILPSVRLLIFHQKLVCFITILILAGFSPGAREGLPSAWVWKRFRREMVVQFQQHICLTYNYATIHIMHVYTSL